MLVFGGFFLAQSTALFWLTAARVVSGALGEFPVLLAGAVLLKMMKNVDEEQS
jgi:hypothetical protein